MWILRKVFIVTWVGLWFGSCLSRTTAADDYIKIGAWNIQNLGEREFGQAPAALAEHMIMADLDVLCLIEIWDNDGDPTRITNRELDQTMERVNTGADQDWMYLLFPKRTPDDLARHVGIAWNRKRVTLVGQPWKIPVAYPNSEAWKRTPYAAKFRFGMDRTDFVLIPLHMKSNRPVEGAPEPVALRAAEARALAAQLNAVQRELDDKDLILLGDFNCLQSEEPALQTLLAEGFKDLNNEDAITYRTAKYRSPFDRILVPVGESEFRYSEQYILTPARGRKHFVRYSDHFLVLTAIRILPDDD